MLSADELIVLNAAVAVATAHPEHLARLVKMSKGAHPIFWTESDGEVLSTPHLNQTVERLVSLLNRAQEVSIA